jgi:RNA-directed DNA polymerase
VVARADTAGLVEGNNGTTETQERGSGVLVRRPRRGPWLGARAQGSHRNLGDLVASGAVGRNGKRSEKPSDSGHEKSERRGTSDEAGEPTRGTRWSKGRRRSMEPLVGKMNEASNSVTVSTKQQRVANLARDAPEMAFNTLAHHIDLAWMREAYRRTRKDGATGVDGQTAQQYEKNLEGNLQKLLDAAKSGAYRAPPVKRVHIPKADGSQVRPIGVPTFEDKVLQRAVVMLLEPVYEEDFKEFSYGFRPRRSAHDALEALRNGIMEMSGGWAVEVDIRKFFDSVDHGRLRDVLRRRVRDGVVLRLIGKWLNAGVLEDSELSFPGIGTPQGGVISPLLANVFLHEVVDVWFVRDVLPRLSGRGRLVRYADDMLFVFEREDDARRVLAVLPKRFGAHGLTLHPEKTRLVKFTRPPRRPPTEADGDSAQGSGTFDFLGFTHYWSRSRAGNTVVKRRTAKDRFSRALRRVKEWCQRHRHDPLRAQQQGLASKLRGHYAYFGITANFAALKRLLHEVTRLWRKWLSTRSRDGRLPWKRMDVVLRRFPLPLPRIVRRHAT